MNLSSNYNFMEVKEYDSEMAEFFVENYLKKYNLEVADLEQNDNEMEFLFFSLKNKYDISLREISFMLNVNREKVRKIYNNTKNNNDSCLS